MIDFTPRPYQQEAFEAAIEQLEIFDSVLHEIPTGCHAAGTPVIKFDGDIVNVEDVQVGDLLMGRDSTPRLVRELVRGEDELVTIVPTKGQPWKVNLDHILSLQRTPQKSRPKFYSQCGGQIVDVSVREWLAWPKWRKHIHKLFRAEIDFPAELRHPLPIPPHYLGILIGDGTLCNSTITVTSNDREIERYLEKESRQFGITVNACRYKDRATALLLSRPKLSKKKQRNPLATCLESLGLRGRRSHDKFIPKIYLTASRNDRLSLLAGLIDTDGHHVADGGFEYTTISERLANDVAFLARSLGYGVSLRERWTQCQTGAGRFSFRLHISGDLYDIPCLILRKQGDVRRQKKSVLRTGFRVERTGERGPYYGFRLDGDHRYLLGDFTVTHNCGKTECAGMLIERWVNDGHRCMYLAHTKELVNQPVQKLYKRIGIMPAVEMGSRRANESEWGRSEIVVASVPSLHDKRLKEEGRWTGITRLVVDEAHHAVSRTYRNVIDHLRSLNPDMKMVGFTATARRHDNKALGQVFEAVGFQYPIESAVRDGWLVSPIAETVTLKSLDLSAATGKHDLSDKQLSKFMQEQKSYFEMAAEAHKHGADRFKTLMFVPRVEDAKAIAGILRDTFGLAADFMSGEENIERREDVVRRFRAGSLTCLVNVGVFTEGFDEPTIEHLVMGRMTKSAPLFRQMYGRGTRPLPGVVDGADLDTPEKRRAAIAASAKPHIRVTDLVDISHRHKLVTTTDILGGRYCDETIERAKQKAEKSGRAISVAEALEEADQEQKREEARRKEEAQRQAEEADRCRRRAVSASVETYSQSVDLFDSHDRSYTPERRQSGVKLPWKVGDAPKGTPIASMDSRLLQWCLNKNMFKGRFGWMAGAIQKELKRRNGATTSPRFDRPGSAPVPMAAGQCTPQQARVLAKHGHPTDVSQAEAARRIAQINRDLSRSRVGA